MSHSGIESVRTPADDILDYAMFAGIIITVVITSALITLGYNATTVTPIMTLTGIIWVFTITPHLIARWLNMTVDELLQLEHSY